MSSSKYTKLGVTIFLAIVSAGIVLTLVQRWMYASNLEKAQAQYLKMAEQTAEKNRAFSEQIQKQQLRKLESQINNTSPEHQTYLARQKVINANLERERRQREFDRERKKSHSGYMSTSTNNVKSPRELELEKQALERRRLNAKNKQEYERKRSSSKTNRETCNYWRDQYKKVRSDYNKNHMEAACKRANSY